MGDLELLFEEGVDPLDAAELFRRKTVHRGLDPAAFAKKYEQRVMDYAPRWERELAEHLAPVPHFQEVERSVRRWLKQARLV